MRLAMMRAMRQRYCAGLSLAELVVVLGMVAVTAAVAAPSLHDLVRSQQLRAASGDLHGAI
ncbi:MAG TPA: type-4 fimbrial pilin related signal peptide protein, partial [Massilia timonae]|nr:type-4 fimbrial pilin related signal peptide protein [Massilia timonae]